MSATERIKWFIYYHFFYFDEDMPFFIFMRRVRKGNIPVRKKVDWSKVKGAHEIYDNLNV